MANLNKYGEIPMGEDRYIAALIAAGDWAYGDYPEDRARERYTKGFSVEQMVEWLNARCFSAERAREMANAGITPEQAGRPKEGYTDTIAYAFCNSDLEGIDEAMELCGIESYYPEAATGYRIRPTGFVQESAENQLVPALGLISRNVCQTGGDVQDILNDYLYDYYFSDHPPDMGMGEALERIYSTREAAEQAALAAYLGPDKRAI